ncbi:putative B3 domain-containing protein Os04g0347400 [Setaria italica]|uniref:putative B3 domain-containing protein Os04g0347400 n=1 Tax=Setaria italica TaxID=4555 RepID=UPI000BE5EDE5|nr:putative B3 domain-containing protein Os04g0347400 [Setaria italica]
MASCGNHVAASAKHLRVLLQFSCDRVGAGKARVVGPSGGKVKVWRVEVGRDGDGAFLGRGWPEIAAAFGVGDGWFLVLQHHGGSVLTLKAFDASGCIRGLVTPPTEATTSSKDVSHRPQFVSVLPHDFMEKMLIPAKFVEHYIPEEHKNSRMAMVIGSLGKICRVELEMNESNLFLRGGWSQVLVSHDVTQANALLLKYEGNTVFTVKVFGPDGFQRESKDKDIRIQQGKQQEAPSESIRNRKSKKDWPSREGQKKPKGSTVSMNEASKRIAVYEIGPHHG